MGPKNNIKNFNPFPGLRPFAPEESDLFFGREGESEEVLRKLVKNKFVTVIGASGSGKSSLIYCGVLPKVRNYKSNDSGSWRIISFRPGDDPFGNLANALTDSLISTGEKKVNREKILSDLKENQEGTKAAVNTLLSKKEENILLVVDQFEELFRYRSLGKTGLKKKPAEKFVDFMVEAVGSSDLNIFTIVTMRSDFIGECAHYQGLTQLINNSNYLIPHMGRENYREAIEGPVKYAGAEIDQQLVEILLADIGDRTDQLPVLQHAMMRTWTHWQAMDDSDRPLGKADYESVGTMSDAMSLHANEAYEELSLRGKEICEMMFKTITEKGSDNKGLRHPSRIDTIKKIASCTSEELSEVVEKFRIPSRSFITPRQNVTLSDDAIIDLSHESLMRLWNRLREWVDDEAASVQMYMRLSEASAMYQQGKTSLWRPPDLQLAINWREKSKPTLTWAERYNPAFERAMVYLRTSEKEYIEEEENKIRLQKKQMRRTRIVAMILGVAAIISVGFMLFAFVQQIAADRQRQFAEENRIKAEFQTVLADSAKVEAMKQKVLADSSATEAILSAEEAKKAQIAAEKQRLFAETQRLRAVEQTQIAQQQTRIAEIQTDSATKAKEKAILSQQEAMRQRMLSVGKAMSIKSLQAEGQQDLQTLLAYQAYLFNKNNGGYENDADIFAGLYNVARQYGSLNYKTFNGHSGSINSITFVPGENEFFSSGLDGQVLKWSLDEKDQALQVVYSGSDIIEVLAVSHDASWLACGSENSVIRMIPLNNNAVGFEMKGHTGMIKSLVFSYDGKYLYSASLDGKVLKWDLAARTSTSAYGGPLKISSIDVSSNGNYLAGISSDGNVLVWRPESISDIFRLDTSSKNVKVIRFSPESNMLAIGDVSGNVELWDVDKKTKINEVKAHTAQVNDIRFNPTLKQMATASNDETVKIFNIADPANLTEPPITFADNEGFVLEIQFSSDGQMIVSGTWDDTQNLIGRPSNVNYLVRDLCSIVSRNMTQDEWNIYVGRDIPLETTCTEKAYNIKVNAIK